MAGPAWAVLLDWGQWTQSPASRVAGASAGHTQDIASDYCWHKPQLTVNIISSQSREPSHSDLSLFCDFRSDFSPVHEWCWLVYVCGVVGASRPPLAEFTALAQAPPAAQAGRVAPGRCVRVARRVTHAQSGPGPGSDRWREPRESRESGQGTLWRSQRPGPGSVILASTPDIPDTMDSATSTLTPASKGSGWWQTPHCKLLKLGWWEGLNWVDDGAQPPYTLIVFIISKCNGSFEINYQ